MMLNDAPESNGLSENQTLALPYLACATSLAGGAKLADISRATITRWMREPKFRDALQRQREEAANLAYTELQGLTLKSVLVLAEALDDPDLATRLRAARATLYVTLKADEARSLRRRLDVLDDALNLLKRQL